MTDFSQNYPIHILNYDSCGAVKQEDVKNKIDAFHYLIHQTEIVEKDQAIQQSQYCPDNNYTPANVDKEFFKKWDLDGDVDTLSPEEQKNIIENLKEKYRNQYEQQAAEFLNKADPNGVYNYSFIVQEDGTLETTYPASYEENLNEKFHELKFQWSEEEQAPLDYANNMLQFLDKLERDNF